MSIPWRPSSLGSTDALALESTLRRVPDIAPDATRVVRPVVQGQQSLQLASVGTPTVRDDPLPLQIAKGTGAYRNDTPMGMLNDLLNPIRWGGAASESKRELMNQLNGGTTAGKVGSFAGVLASLLPIVPEAKMAKLIGREMQAAKGIEAWHGSPYNFDAFDLTHMGSGEGSSMVAPGVNLAASPGTAEHYREMLALKAPDKRGVLYRVDVDADPESLMKWDAPLREQPSEIGKALRQFTKRIRNDDLGHVAFDKADVSLHNRMVDADAQRGNWSNLEELAKTYGIDNARSYRNANGDLRYYTRNNKELLSDIMAHPNIPPDQKRWASMLAEGDPRQSIVSELSAAGVPGIELTADARGMRSPWFRPRPDDTKNYLIFDPKRVSILDKLGIAAGVGGAANATARGSQ